MGTPAPGIHGRAAETQVLDEALDRVAAGRSAVVLIEGEAGIGKTRLLAEAVSAARRRDMQVAAGRAEEFEQGRPFGLVARAFQCDKASPDPRRAEVARTLGVGGTGDPGPITVTSDPGLQFRAVDAFADLMEDLALAGPLLIGVDDLQWADSSSLLTLAALSRRLKYLPVGLIGCFRPLPRPPELDRLRDVLAAAGARQLTLRGLSPDAVTELVSDALSAVPGQRLVSGISGAAGNPLFVTELLAALGQEGAIQTSGGQAEVAVMALPPTLRLTILRRLSFLPDETLQALRAASILGSGFTVTDLSVIMARPALELARVLTEGIEGQVLEDDGDRLRFRHDLIRDAIYEDLPQSVRRGLHREAGQRLAGSGAPVIQVAEQFARGAADGDIEAIGWLTSAAREAAATSPDAAAGLLERAIRLMNAADPDRDRMVTELASSLILSGRVAQAEDVCRSLLARVHDPRSDGPARICLGHALVAGGRPDEGLRQLERADELSLLTSAERASGLSWASIALRWLGDVAGSASTAEQALSAAVPDSDHLTIATAMASLAAASELRSELSAALRIIDDAVRLADRSPGRQAHRYPLHATRAFILVDLDRFEEARSALDADRRTSDELGLGWHLPSYQMVRIVERFTVGEWDDALAEVEASVELAEETGLTFGLTIGRSVLSLISLHRNELGRAGAAADAVLGQLTQTGARYRTQWVVWAHALLLEADGRTAEAFATLADCWDQCAELGLTLEYRMLGADLVRLALVRDDRERALAVAASVGELAAENPGLASLAGAALRCRGLAEDDAEILASAVAAYTDGSRPLELALACEDAGTAFARQGRVHQVRPFLGRAIDMYERLDASRDLARAEAVLRDTGIRRGRRGPRSRPQIGWASLTPTEQTVAGLVAEGLSNPQIGDRLYISPRTVQTHLGHVFTKLDLSSRAHLAAEVTRRDRTAAGGSATDVTPS